MGSGVLRSSASNDGREFSFPLPAAFVAPRLLWAARVVHIASLEAACAYAKLTPACGHERSPCGCGEDRSSGRLYSGVCGAIDCGAARVRLSTCRAEYEPETSVSAEPATREREARTLEDQRRSPAAWAGQRLPGPRIAGCWERPGISQLAGSALVFATSPALR